MIPKNAAGKNEKIYTKVLLEKKMIHKNAAGKK